MSAPLVSRRDAPVICAGCGRQVQRRSRQQRFCSDRCRNREIGRRRVRKASLGRDTGAPANRPKKANKLKALQRAKMLSSRRIFGPADVLGVEVWGGHSWEPSISSSACESRSATCAKGHCCHEQEEGAPATGVDSRNQDNHGNASLASHVYGCAHTTTIETMERSIYPTATLRKPSA